jgi:hypothetical protein
MNSIRKNVTTWERKVSKWGEEVDVSYQKIKRVSG